MKGILGLIKSYFILVVLIIFIKMAYNYWALWGKVSRMEEFSTLEMHFIIFLNAAIYGFTLAALAMIFLAVHASFLSFKVRRENRSKFGK